jgi:hypothetical protein
MSTLTILIIRHAEKPGESWPGEGLTADEVKDTKSLVIRGWQRAGSWSALFGSSLGDSDYLQPGEIYAADPASESGEEPSQRPSETVSPLADRLGLKINTTFALGQESDLATEVTSFSGGVILVCWEHKKIVETLLPAIGKEQKIPGIPTKWSSDRFDVVLRFDRLSPDAPWSFRQLFPKLLSADSDKALG